MAGQSATAEHELLKTIERGSTGPGPEGGDGTSSGGNFADRLVEWSKNLEGSQVMELFTVPKIKRALLIALGVLVLAYGFVVFRGLRKLGDMPRFELAGIKSVPDTAGVELDVEDFGFYLRELVSRNIFTVKQVEEPVVAAPTKPWIVERADSLKLVGIAWNDDADERYAMVEDTSTNLTYYVREGEGFLKFKVTEIARQYVTIGAGDEEIDLR